MCIFFNTSSRWCSRWKPWQRGKPGPRELHHRPSPSPSHPAVPPHTPGQGHPGAGQQWPGHTHAGTDLRTAADADWPLDPLACFAWLIFYTETDAVECVKLKNLTSWICSVKRLAADGNKQNLDFELCWICSLCNVKLSIDWLICRLSLDEEFPGLVMERLLIERTTDQDLTPPGMFFLFLCRTFFML